MSKVFIVLDEKEQIMVERVCLDKDPQEALEFMLSSVVPKMHKAIPCADKALEIYGPWKGRA